MKFLAILKKNSLTIIFFLFLVCLVIYSNNNLIAAKNGLSLWATCVVPSLFPFFIATELLNYTNIAQIFGRLLSKIMRPLFNIPGEGAYAFIMGIISGYPVGAKIVADFYENGICTKNEAERMLAFTNNSGPLFIIGTVGILLFGNSYVGILLFTTHLLSSITVGILFGIKSKFENNNFVRTKNNMNARVDQKNFCRTPAFSGETNNLSKMKKSNLEDTCSLSNLGNILYSSIQRAISTILQIGGFVVLFSVILSIFNRLHIISYFSNFLALFSIPKDFSFSLISGIIELTNGVSLAANLHVKTISINIILCSFLLGFGGFSILLQVLGIISRVGLNIKKYLYGKFLQGIIAALYTSILINYFSVFRFDINYSLQNFSTKTCSVVLFMFLIIFIIPFLFRPQKLYNHNRKFN